jgi:RNA polymerase sigma-70 factor (ECF subfamily)
VTASPSASEPAEPERGLVEVFTAERPRLVGLAYRMTGSRVDAEDIVQEAWLRAQRVDWATIERPAAWLNRVVARLALDDLRSARRRRERYVGPWLAEPVWTPSPRGLGLDSAAAAPVAATDAQAGSVADTADTVELAETLTYGFLRLLDALKPIERVVFLLADVFDTPYGEIAPVVDRSPEACRQIASRARRRVRDSPPRHDPPGEAARVAAEVLAAVVVGDVDRTVSLLAEDVVLVSDGGPGRRAARRPVLGPARVARFLINLTRRDLPELSGEAEMTTINGEPALLVHKDGHPLLTICAQVAEGTIHALHIVSNPAKLAALDIRTPMT